MKKDKVSSDEIELDMALRPSRFDDYSGQEAVKKNLKVAVISTGGKLLEVAEKRSIPYIKLPDTGIEPRMALGFMVRAILKLLGEDILIEPLISVPLN